MIHPDLSKKRLTLSACLIVKDEEKNLPACLASIKDFVDEIIVVDTGSADRTVAVAESFGAKVFHHPWRNHFSLHRNQSLDYAGGDWLLIIDADETLQPGSGELLRRSVDLGEDIDAVTVLLECAFGPHSAQSANNAVRLLRNHRGLHYEGRVHNCLLGVKKAVCAPIRIRHHGFIMDRETRLRRFKRTTELLKQDIRENPRNPRPHHFLAASYLSENMPAQAAQEAEQALALFEADHQFHHNYLWSIYIAASACLDLGRVQKAATLARKGIRTNPDHLDSYYLLALIAYRQKDPSRFSEYLNRFLETKTLIEKDPSRFGEMVHNTFASQWLLQLLNAFLLLDGPDPSRFQTEWALSRALCPDPFLFYQQSGNCYLDRKNFAQAEKQYLSALELKADDADMIWILSCIYEKQSDPSRQIIWLEKLLKIDPQFPHARFQLALVYMRLGNYPKSYDLFGEVLAADPSNNLVRVNMALCLRGMEKYEESIRVSAAVQTEELQEQATLAGNLAYCHYAFGQTNQALLHFQKWSELQPQALEPPVYLARLLLEHQEFEACVVQCDRLLTILGLNQKQVLNSLAELGALFFCISRHPSLMPCHDLIQVCEEISRLLGYQNKS